MLLSDTKPELNMIDIKSEGGLVIDQDDPTDSQEPTAAGSDGCSCFLCNQCPQSFDTLDALETHMNVAHDMDAMDEMITEEDDEERAQGACTPNSDVMSDSSSPTSIGGTPPSSSTRTPKQYVCRFCQKVFDTRSHLNIHYTHTHRDKPQYECDLCDMVFAVKRELSTHRRTHSGECTHICTQCSKEFGTRQLLKKHWMWHTGERSHVCPHCSKAFFQKGHLTQHLMIHAGGRPHVCGLCSKTFIFKFDLNRHMKIHQERGFACDTCGRAFLKETDLRSHEPSCDGVRIESSASGDTFMLSPPASVHNDTLSTQHMKELDTHSDMSSSLTAPESIISPPPSVTKTISTNSSSSQKGKRKHRTASTDSPIDMKSKLSSHAALMNNINNVVTKNTAVSNGGVTANASLFPSAASAPNTHCGNNTSSNSANPSAFFCFLCMRPFPSQAAYTLHVTYEHFKGAVQQLGQQQNTGSNGKSPQQTNHGTKPAAILNGLRQSGIDVTQAFGQMSSAQALLIAQMAAASNNNNNNNNMNSQQQQQQQLLFNIVQQQQKKMKLEQNNNHNNINSNNEQSFNSSPTGALDTSGSDGGSTGTNVSCGSCLTSDRRTREVQSLLVANESELVAMRSRVKRVQGLSATLLQSCSDFDKLWMMQNKPIQAILNALNEI